MICEDYCRPSHSPVAVPQLWIVRRYESFSFSVDDRRECVHLGGWDVDCVLFGFGIFSRAAEAFDLAQCYQSARSLARLVFGLLDFIQN
jgi:hypothetical protein